MNKINHPQSQQQPQLSYQVNGNSPFTNHPTIIGKITPTQTLNCHISPQPQHKFTINHKPLHTLTTLFKKRVKLAFDNIAAITYQLKINSTNVFIPEALLDGNADVMRQYKKRLQSSKIGAYIRLNLRRQEVSREKRADTTAQQLLKPKLQAAQYKPNISTSISQYQLNISQTHHYTHRKITQHRSSRCHTKKASDSGLEGITINYYEVNRSDKKDNNPQMTTYVYPNRSLNGSNLRAKSSVLINYEDSSTKSVRQKNRHQSNQRVRKNSTTKTDIIRLQQQFISSTVKQNHHNISNSQLSTIRPNRAVSSYLTVESPFKNPQDSVNEKMIAKDGLMTEKKGHYQGLFSDEIMTGKGLVMGGKQRTIGKRKAKHHEHISIDLFE